MTDSRSLSPVSPQPHHVGPARTLQEAAQTTVLQPLAAGDDRYVDLSPGQESRHLLLMRQCLEDIAERPGDPMRENDYTKIVFSGHRGSGKTTHLRLIEQEFADRFYCVHLSLDDENLLEDFDYTVFLLWLSEQLVHCLKRDGIGIDERLVKEVALWFAERTATDVNEAALSGSIGLEGEASAGGGLLGFGLKLLGRIKSEARGSVTRREEIRTKLQSHASDLMDKVNLLLSEAREQLNKNGRPPRLLVVQDNLDKLKSDIASRFYADTSGLLRQVQAHIIFTAPVAETLTPFKIENVFVESFQMPMIHACTQDGRPFDPGISVLRELVERRIAAGLFEDEELIRRICIASGGNVRDLVRLASQSARMARALRLPRINGECVEEAIKGMRQEYEKTLAPRARIYYPFLAGIHRTKLYGAGPGDSEEVLRDLLDNSAILVYKNGDIWYDVHPTIRESKAFRKALEELDDQ